jgi:hypothetical protein
MGAGGGVCHGKEMSPPDDMSRIQGFQFWLALPPELEKRLETGARRQGRFRYFDRAHADAETNAQASTDLWVNLGSSPASGRGRHVLCQNPRFFLTVDWIGAHCAVVQQSA